ncbi:ATP-binding protein [Streptomyces sp. NPDC052042]|uniref:ATP-binding protein n=1 Tax=Streptomyces sp. NPDC052042 TaxID=3365683 RepID=UPI0037D5D410
MATATVSPPWAYTLQLPRDPRAPGVARATLRTALRVHGMPELVENVELLASELVTNAYLHSEGPYSLRLREAGRGRVRLGVRDTSPHIPAPFRRGVTPPAESAGRGRGLYLVTLYAESWGAVPLCAGVGRPERSLPDGESSPDRRRSRQEEQGSGLLERGLSGQGGKLLWVECAAKEEGAEDAYESASGPGW